MAVARLSRSRTARSAPLGVDPLLGDLLGRKPRTVRDLLAER
jgi:hypothetical protein